MAGGGYHAKRMRWCGVGGERAHPRDVMGSVGREDGRTELERADSTRAKQTAHWQRTAVWRRAEDGIMKDGASEGRQHMSDGIPGGSRQHTSKEG